MSRWRQINKCRVGPTHFMMTPESRAHAKIIIMRHQLFIRRRLMIIAQSSPAMNGCNRCDMKSIAIQFKFHRKWCRHSINILAFQLHLSELPQSTHIPHTVARHVWQQVCPTGLCRYGVCCAVQYIMQRYLKLLEEFCVTIAARALKLLVPAVVHHISNQVTNSYLNKVSTDRKPSKHIPSGCRMVNGRCHHTPRCYFNSDGCFRSTQPILNRPFNFQMYITSRCGPRQIHCQTKTHS